VAASSPLRIPVTTPTSPKAAGLNFKQDGTGTDQKYYLETIGTGVAWLDYDQEKLMDIFFVQSSATDIYKPAHPLRCALYHNNGDGTFTEVTDQDQLRGCGACLRYCSNDGLAPHAGDRLL
jgi:hypothetical protein